MLSAEIAKIERENRHLKELLQRCYETIPQAKQCENCKYYIRHYGRRDGLYYRLYTGHCVCGVPIGKRKGKSHPTPEDTCLCYEKGAD